MYILTFTKQGSDFVDYLTSPTKEEFLKSSLTFFERFTLDGSKFTKDDLFNLISGIIDPYNKLSKNGKMQFTLGEFVGTIAYLPQYVSK